MRAMTLLAAAALGVAACTKAPDLSADEAAIRQADTDMVGALNAQNIAAWLAFFADDARMMPPGTPPVVGKAAIHKLIVGFVSPELHVAHHLEGVVVSGGGDLAYVWYAYELTSKGPTGAPVTEKGKDISVYKKASDRSWKLVGDMWSENESPSS